MRGYDRVRGLIRAAGFGRPGASGAGVVRGATSGYLGVIVGTIMVQSRMMACEYARRDWTRWLRRVVLGGLVSFAAVMALPAGTALAQEEGSSVWDSFTGLFKGLRFGSNPDAADIEYRERSPLVVPPSHALPPPQAPGTATRVPNWPTDTDVKRRQEAAEKRRRGEGRFDYDKFTATETPSQLNATPPGAKSAAPSGSGSNGDMTAAMKPSELGSPGLFGLFKSDPKETVFTGEKPRRTLTEPPPGYQTPSPDQPYGIAPPTAAKPTKPQDVPVGDVGL